MNSLYIYTHILTYIYTHKGKYLHAYLILCVFDQILLHATPHIRSHHATLHYTTPHYTTLYDTTLHNTMLHYPTPHAMLRYTALRLTALQHVTTRSYVRLYVRLNSAHPREPPKLQFKRKNRKLRFSGNTEK